MVVSVVIVSVGQRDLSAAETGALGHFAESGQGQFSMTDELYYSNDGRGPMIARVVFIENGIVTMERKLEKGHHGWKRFELPESFLNSTQCGWRKRPNNGLQPTPTTRAGGE